MGLKYNDKTGEFVDENASKICSCIRPNTIPPPNYYAQKQAKQVWDDIRKSMDWFPFKCYCTVGVISGSVAMFSLLLNGIFDIFRLTFIPLLIFGLVGPIGGLIGTLLLKYVFRYKVKRYIKNHTDSAYIRCLKDMLDNCEPKFRI